MRHIDTLFMSRTARYRVFETGIVVIDPNSPRVITMDPWPQLIFLSADGAHTVAQFVDHLSAQYEGGAPAGLTNQIHDIVSKLERDGLLHLHAEPMPLPSMFQEPSANAGT